MNSLNVSRVWMLALLVSSLPAIAQITGRINGRVLDASGASIANVRLTLTESDTKVSRVGLSDANGLDRKSTRLNSSHLARSRMPSSA